MLVGNISTGAYYFLPGSEGGNDSVWSPNSRTIAFDRTPDGDFSIYLIPYSGGTPTLIIPEGIEADWSYNGKFIAYTQASSGLLYTYDVATGSLQALGIPGINPSWSGNGRYLAYSSNDDIFVVRMNPKGTTSGVPVNLTSDTRFNSQPTWSRNSRSIFYHSGGGGVNFDIWVPLFSSE